MRILRLRSALALSALIAASSALAAECRQEKAIYGDADGAYELAFEPVGSQAAATSHHFKVRVRDTDLVLDGIVMTGDEVVRSNGMIMHKCPEGDATGAELAACTVWEGIIYAADGVGNIDLLPSEGGDAASQLLLPGFGPAVHYAAIWGDGAAGAAPWDVLALKGCGS